MLVILMMACGGGGGGGDTICERPATWRDGSYLLTGESTEVVITEACDLTLTVTEVEWNDSSLIFEMDPVPEVGDVIEPGGGDWSVTVTFNGSYDGTFTEIFRVYAENLRDDSVAHEITGSTGEDTGG